MVLRTLGHRRGTRNFRSLNVDNPELEKAAAEIASHYNDINGETTMPFGWLYPDDSFVEATEDYSPISLDINENNLSLVIDFASDHDTPKARGASVGFHRAKLRLFIAMLTAALETLDDLEARERLRGQQP